MLGVAKDGIFGHASLSGFLGVFNNVIRPRFASAPKVRFCNSRTTLIVFPGLDPFRAPPGVRSALTGDLLSRRTQRAIPTQLRRERGPDGKTKVEGDEGLSIEVFPARSLGIGLARDTDERVLFSISNGGGGMTNEGGQQRGRLEEGVKERDRKPQRAHFRCRLVPTAPPHDRLEFFD